MDLVLQGLLQSKPELFDAIALKDDIAVTIPVKIDGVSEVAPVIGQAIGHSCSYVNGHVLRTAGELLRWASVTVEGGRTKYDFVADMTLIDGKLSVVTMQMNTLLMGVQLLSPKDAADYLGEYMDDMNDWHIN